MQRNKLFLLMICFVLALGIVAHRATDARRLQQALL